MGLSAFGKTSPPHKRSMNFPNCELASAFWDSKISII
jgi:hypothetical protein